MFDLNCLVLAGKSSNELVCRFHDITSEDGRKWWIKLGLRSGSTKGVFIYLFSPRNPSSSPLSLSITLTTYFTFRGLRKVVFAIWCSYHLTKYNFGITKNRKGILNIVPCTRKGCLWYFASKFDSSMRTRIKSKESFFYLCPLKWSIS